MIVRYIAILGQGSGLLFDVLLGPFDTVHEGVVLVAFQALVFEFTRCDVAWAFVVEVVANARACLRVLCGGGGVLVRWPLPSFAWAVDGVVPCGPAVCATLHFPCVAREALAE